MQRVAGIGVSPGLVSGRAVMLNQRAQVLRYRVPAARIEHEIARLERGRQRTREQLQDIRDSVARRRGADQAPLPRSVRQTAPRRRSGRNDHG